MNGVNPSDTELNTLQFTWGNPTKLRKGSAGFRSGSDDASQCAEGRVKGS